MTSIAFTGDIAFSKYFAKGYENPNLMDGEIVDFLQTADHVVANVEAPVTGGDIQSERKLNHVNPPEAVPLLLHLNARIWNLANNHTMDCREQGMWDTLDMAAQNGVATLGAGMCKKDAARIVELPGSGGVGLFSVTYYRDFLKAGEDTPGCITCDDLETIQKNISEIKSRNRWCVMVVHDGGEFSNMPMPFFRRRYLKYLEMGADVIVGHHPHVVQNWEQVGDKLIFYSLGNFVFDTDYQRKQQYSEYGVLVKLRFTETAVTWESQGTCVERENNRIAACAPPAIFAGLDSKAYARLWPLGAVNYCRTDRMAGIWLKPEKAKYGALRWLWDDIGFHGFWPALEMLWGRTLARLGVWKKSDPKLIEYLR